VDMWFVGRRETLNPDHPVIVLLACFAWLGLGVGLA